MSLYDAPGDYCQANIRVRHADGTERPCKRWAYRQTLVLAYAEYMWLCWQHAAEAEQGEAVLDPDRPEVKRDAIP